MHCNKNIAAHKNQQSNPGVRPEAGGHSSKAPSDVSSQCGRRSAILAASWLNSLACSLRPRSGFSRSRPAAPVTSWDPWRAPAAGRIRTRRRCCARQSATASSPSFLGAGAGAVAWFSAVLTACCAAEDEAIEGLLGLFDAFLRERAHFRRNFEIRAALLAMESSLLVPPRRCRLNLYLGRSPCARQTVELARH